MIVHTTSFFIVVDVQRTFLRRRVRVGRKNDVHWTPGRKKTPGNFYVGVCSRSPANLTYYGDELGLEMLTTITVL